MSIIRFYKNLGFFWKVTLPILVILPLSTLANSLYIRTSAKTSLVDSSVLFARATIEQFKILRSYYTENVVQKAKASGAINIGVDHIGKSDTIPLPATMIHDLSEQFARTESGLRLKLYSEHPFPNRKDRTLDAFAKEAVKYLKVNPDEVLSRIVNDQGRESVRVAIADKMVAESCVHCHNSLANSPFREWKVGDVRGVLEVEVPIKRQVAAYSAMANMSSGLNIGAAVILLLVIASTLFYCISKPVRNIVEKLNLSVDDTLDRGATLSASSIAVSSACTEQAAAIQETVSTLSEIQTMTSRSVESAKASIGMSKSSHNIALEGKKSVSEMTLAFGEIEANNSAVAAQVDQSNRRVAEIIQVISEIETKTNVINDIVFQTKLLSFNASVEAARAGENGKGFAVVAEEVGKLAQMSGNAAKEISDMLAVSIQKVETIVEETKANVGRIIQSGTQKVESGNTIAKRCSEILDEVVANVNEVDKMMGVICSAAQEQASGVSGITEAMEQLDQTTHQNAQSADKTSAISKELNEQAKALRELVNLFAAQALGASAPKKTRPNRFAGPVKLA